MAVAYFAAPSSPTGKGQMSLPPSPSSGPFAPLQLSAGSPSSPAVGLSSVGSARLARVFTPVSSPGERVFATDGRGGLLTSARTMPAPPPPTFSSASSSRAPGQHSFVPSQRPGAPQDFVDDVVSPVPASFPLDRSRRSNPALSARGGTGRISHSYHNERIVRPSAGAAGGPEPAHDAEQDLIHEAVTRFCDQRQSSRFPMVRHSKGVYLYGNKKLVIAIHNDKLMVRIGGGFVHVDPYLLEADRNGAANPVTAPQVKRVSKLCV